MRIEKELKRWIMFHVKAELEGDPSLKRDDLIHSVLGRFVRSGDAERYIRENGKVAWRLTTKFREWLKEGEADCDEFDDAA